LDPTAEGIVQAALDRVSRSRTTIMIAHKLVTVMKADNIIVLEKGSVIEQGTHQELLRKKGAYFKLVLSQELGVDKDFTPEVGNDDVIEEAELVELGNPSRTISSTYQSNVTRTAVDSELRINRGLIACLFFIIKESVDLWKWCVVIIFVALIGGKHNSGLYSK
jgi:ATP-binding cassette subfamily B (MDR/TAP) protein 1